MIALLAELDARRLYLAEGCSSLFTCCTQVLHLSEHAAYGRIEAARASRQWPVILDLLADGSLHLTAVALLSRRLTTENHCELLTSARHKSKREVEEIVAALRPEPPVRSSVRKLPAPAAGSAPGMLAVSGAETPDAARAGVRLCASAPPPPPPARESRGAQRSSARSRQSGTRCR